MRRLLAATYIVAIHCALLGLLIKPGLIDSVLTKVGIYEDHPKIAAKLRRNISVLEQQPAGSVVFLGDSITESLVADSVVPLSANLGIGGLTTSGLARHVRGYDLSTARAVSVAIGVNDVFAKRDAATVADDFAAILSAIPPHLPVIVSGVFPGPKLDQQAVEAVTGRISRSCARRQHCTFIATDSLPPDSFREDGIHLSKEGYGAWAEKLRAALE